jgi:hypothetical protein
MGGDRVTAAAHRDELAHTIAHVVCDVPGVAFLRPGIVDLLRASARSGLPNPEGSPSGVRLTPRAQAGWDVDVQIVVQHGHRALDVARAACLAVRAVLPDQPPAAQVRVTVTNAV